MKRTTTKLAALLIAAIMILSVFAGCATVKNPSIGRVGSVNFKLADYVKYFNQYAMYANYMEDYNGYIKSILIDRGVILTKAKELGITLTEEEEKAIDESAQKQIDEQIDGTVIDAGITGEEAILKAKTKAYEAKLKANGFYKSLKELKAALVKDLREDKIIEKCRDQIYSGVSIAASAVAEYAEANTPKDKEKYDDPKTGASSFSDAYSKYITGSGMSPLYIPADMFNVKHCLIQFENQADVSDKVEGKFSEEDQKKIDDIVAALQNGMTLDEFITSYVENGDYNDDTIFVPGEDDGTIETNPQLGYREHGYIMNEQLLSKYYDGFGAAACVLYYGDEWVIPADPEESTVTPAPTDEPEATPAPTGEPETTPEPTAEPETTAEPTAEPETTAEPTGEPETTAEPTDEPETTPAPTDEPVVGELTPAQKYHMEFFETTDGHKIVKVQTNVKGGGVHFIWVHETLTEGEVDVSNQEGPEYKSIEKSLLSEAQQKRFTESLDAWKNEVKVALNDKYIDTYCRDYLGYAAPAKQ